MEELGCIFADLVEKYKLAFCGMKERQKWRDIKGLKTTERLKLYYNYIPELINLPYSLDKYVNCETHYNQLFVNPQFYESLTGSSSSSKGNKRTRLENKDDLAIELDRTNKFLETTQQENQRMSQLIVNLNSQIE
ncbi:hypothetical protein C2G38_2041626 [Gigaspora rosea]|uniref:Uncharacterized protein n=1 Tax=Gigaspora rosea TaxID=44941 RepID=A0A397USU2_9GLOM|nr:hypothetical protein C2G38_2041626 [Gigaspora rosea]